MKIEGVKHPSGEWTKSSQTLIGWHSSDIDLKHFANPIKTSPLSTDDAAGAQ